MDTINLVKVDNGLIYGLQEPDKALLAHVSNNSEGVTEELFHKVIKYLLSIHGVNQINITFTPEPVLESLNINFIKND